MVTTGTGDNRMGGGGETIRKPSQFFQSVVERNDEIGCCPSPACRSACVWRGIKGPCVTILPRLARGQFKVEFVLWVDGFEGNLTVDVGRFFESLTVGEDGIDVVAKGAHLTERRTVTGTG